MGDEVGRPPPVLVVARVPARAGARPAGRAERDVRAAPADGGLRRRREADGRRARRRRRHPGRAIQPGGTGLRRDAGSAPAGGALLRAEGALGHVAGGRGERGLRARLLRRDAGGRAARAAWAARTTRSSASSRTPRSSGFTKHRSPSCTSPTRGGRRADVALLIETAGEPAALAPAARALVRETSPGSQVLATTTLASPHGRRPGTKTGCSPSSAPVSRPSASSSPSPASTPRCRCSPPAGRGSSASACRSAPGRRTSSRLVLRHGLALALAGAASGIPGALVAAGLVRGFLHGVSPLDPRVLVASAAGRRAHGPAGLRRARAARAAHRPRARPAARVISSPPHSPRVTMEVVMARRLVRPAVS